MLIMLSRELLVTGNYDKAMEKVNEAITQAKKQMKGNPTTNLTTLKKGLANAYNIKGNINFAHGNYNEALRNHFSALNIRVEFGDKSGISSSYNNIGNIYYHQNNDKEALKNYFHSLKIREEIDDKKGIANSYVTIGNIYYGKAVLLSSDSAFFQSLLYSKALHNYHAALKIQEEIGDKNGIASSLINIGTINNLLKNLTIQEIIF
ncbi:MAG: hypothetical protein A3H98_00790 [Bacteroidetes bacterium RIFCSPLOWO2_02_FULL_36_8]|nr:MAG: hypothetical protein A3H98_00790 [Bacteroidetes bacterium RIFCSPLOWO2_02_FULL_36_8]